MSHYIQYYDQQIGGNIRGVRSVYSGSAYQRGSGIGSFLGSIFRKIVPYLAKGAKAVGKEALRTGLNVFDDVTNGDIQFKDSFNSRVKESGKNLKRKAVQKLNDMMEGSGYKRAGIKRKRQSKKNRVSARNSLKRKSKKRKTTKKKETKKKKEEEGKC